MPPWSFGPIIRRVSPGADDGCDKQPATRGMKSSIPVRGHPSIVGHGAATRTPDPMSQTDRPPGRHALRPPSTGRSVLSATCRPTHVATGWKVGLALARAVGVMRQTGTPTVRASGELPLSGWENPGEWVAACGMRACTQLRLSDPAPAVRAAQGREVQGRTRQGDEKWWSRFARLRGKWEGNWIDKIGRLMKTGSRD